MAANMMEMLRQMQQDQKESIKYLHDKFHFVERKIIELDKKIDQQQLPIKRLEEQVRKNNTLLFGNDETETNIEDSTTMFHSDNDKNPLEPSTKIIDTVQPKNYSKTKVEDTQFNLNETFKREEDIDVARKASIENTAGISLKKQDIEVFSVKLVADQINQLDEKLNRITDMYQSDMREMKNIIKSYEAVTTGFSQDKSNHLNLVLVRLTEINQKELSGMKEFMKNYAERMKHETITELKEIAETKWSEIKEVIKNFKMPVAANTACQNKTVQISPTYFSADQISKLNGELKRIAETYQGANTFPVIEVKPGLGEHRFLKHLRKGVVYKGTKGSKDAVGIIKLGTQGMKTVDVMDLVTEYPDLTFDEVIRELLVSRNEWEKTSAQYDMTSPKIYNKNDKLVPLRI